MTGSNPGAPQVTPARRLLRTSVLCAASSSAELRFAQLGVVGDGELDDVDDVLIVYEVDLALALAAGPHQAGEFELAQVVADGGHALPDVLGQRANVTFVLGEQPNEVQPHSGREQPEGGRGVLQQLGR
jgi:hypothetical protein